MALLEKHVYPALETLPAAEKSALAATLSNIETGAQSNPTEQQVAAIAYETHQKSLKRSVRELSSHCRQDHMDGWEDQFEMMKEIVGEICKWLPTLWHVGVEQGVEIPLVQKCLAFCTSIYDQAAGCDSRADLCDCRGAVKIRDTKGSLIYEERDMNTMLAWMWRELLVKAAASKDTSLTKSIRADIANFTDQFEDPTVFELIRSMLHFNFSHCIVFYLSNYLLANRSDKHRKFWDAHWSKEMKAAASHLVKSTR